MRSRRADCGPSTCRRSSAGPELSYATLSRVIEIISAADSSIGQIPQNHIGVVAAIRTVSDEAQQKLLFAEVLEGNRASATRSRNSARSARPISRRGSRTRAIMSSSPARKFYATGALLAHLVPIVATDDEGRAWYAIAERGADGPYRDRRLVGVRTAHDAVGHCDSRPCESAEDSSRPGLQGLRPPDRGRRDLPDHPGRGRHRHRQGGDRRRRRVRAHEEPAVDRLGQGPRL